MSESIRKESSDPINVGDLFGKPATEKTLQRIADSLERIEMITTAELRILCAVFGIRNPFQQKSEENSTDLHAEFEKEGGNDDKILGCDADCMEQREGNKERLEKALLNYVETSLKEPSKKSASEIEAVPPIAQILLKLWGIS